MGLTTPEMAWSQDHVAQLSQSLAELHMTYADMDEALGYAPSRGSWTRQICECGREPSKEYRKRLARWLARKPQPRPEPDFLLRIQTVVVPWLKSREGDRIGGSFTRRRAEVARKRMGKHK